MDTRITCSPLFTYILHCLIGVHKFKDNITENFKQRQESTESSVGSFSVLSFVQFCRLCSHEASPNSGWGMQLDLWEQPWQDHLVSYLFQSQVLDNELFMEHKWLVSLLQGKPTLVGIVVQRPLAFCLGLHKTSLYLKSYSCWSSFFLSSFRHPQVYPEEQMNLFLALFLRNLT